MPGLVILRSAMDVVERRVLFALELGDPVTGLPVSDGIVPSIEGFAPPVLTPSRRFVWRDDGPPQERELSVALAISNPMFGKPEKPLDYTIPPNDGTTRPPPNLLRKAVLTTTSRYQPPAGLTGVAGTVVRGGGSNAPMPGVKVSIELSHDGAIGTFVSRHVAITDKDGDFAAVVRGLDGEKPDSDPAIPGSMVGWLRLEGDLGTITRNVEPPLRLGRMTRLTKPVKWFPDPP